MSAIIKEVKSRGMQVAEVKSDAEQAWVDEILNLAAANAGGAGAFLQECTPGYYNREGTGAGLGGVSQNSPYAPGINAFNKLLAAWREEGQLDGYQLSK